MRWMTGGKLVLPDRVMENGSLLIGGDRIAEIGGSRPEGAEVVDVRGGYILPGFIDLHVHGGGGADFMDNTPDAIRTAACAHCAHGTTAIVPTTLTCSDERLEQFIARYLEAKRTNACGADLLGIHLEGPYFSTVSKGAQPVTAQRIPREDALERILALAQGEVIRWDAAPELENMEMFAAVMKRHGVLPAVAHTSATAGQAELAFVWGFSHVTHFYNAMTTFHKVNRRVYAGVIEAAYLNDSVTIELIGDGRHVPKQSMLLALRIKGADNIALITDAIRAAGTDETHSVLGPLDSGVPVVVSDNVAQLQDFSSYAGSVATLDRVLRVAHLEYGIPLLQTSRMLSLTPARLSGVAKRKGSLEVGKDADIVVMTDAFQVSRVYVRGELRHKASA